jgi:hypothetical protein
MKPFSHNYFLGYVNEVTPQYIKIHFPSSILLNKFHFEGTSYTGGGVGNFVVIEGDEYGFLAQLTEVKLSDSEKKELTEKAIEHKDSDFHPIGKAELLLSFSVYEPHKVEKTVSKYPSIGAKVYSCSDNQITKYVSEFGYKGNDDNVYASLGRLISSNVECNVVLNSLLGRHCAVVGTTGGGKSWTISKLIEEITNKTDNKIILIDATGEYKELVKDENQYIIGENVYFSFKEMKNSDFCFLFREHSPNTSNTLCEAINSLKLIYLNKFDGIKLGKSITEINRIITQNTSNLYGTDFDIQKLPNQIKNECVKQGVKGIYEEDTFKLGYCSHLISRVNVFLQNSVIQKAFGINIDNKKFNDINDIINEFIDTPKSKILRIGFEELSYDFGIREIIVDFISLKLLEKSRRKIFQTYPLVLFVDEAHQFLNKRFSADDDSSFYLQNIEFIAKEARKNGLFLCLATQMPRDIPIGTLSQMGTFIVHRLINEQDKKAIENAVSSASRNSLSFLPILGEGEALLVGVDFPMPLLLKIDEPSVKPNSKTPKFSKKG